MDATRWIQLKDLFRQAFDLPREERAEFLDAQCADANLRARIEALLDAEDESARAQETSHSGGGAVDPAAAGPQVNELPGTIIGAYKLLQRIGEGGFGTVFMAEQQHPVRRRVTLKIIKMGMDTVEIVARFEQERQALAMMDHPNIARVFDGGATATGRPYFVMELVRGVPIVEYCDTHHLSIRERLELFTRVCQAVQHAHQKGVIHRDLKPSNVLVAALDGLPQPKVIDFGIAKAVRERLTDRTFFTNFQQMVGTPQYMSPEQADGSLDIDTRSDVYSLGVVLYELLTGAPPFDVRRFRSVADIQRAIREIEPSKPSARLGDWQAWRRLPSAGDSPAAADGDSAAAVGIAVVADGASSAIDVARQRRVDLPALVRQLRGEPDWIVMKALEKDRARRYESVGALAADVERFLDDEPVLAGPPSHLYRLRKFARRNRTMFVAIAAVVVSLLLGLVGTLFGLFRAQAAHREEASQRSRAETREKEAQAEAKKSRQIAALLESILDSAQPSVAKGRDSTLLREILESGESRIDNELSEQPEVAASLRRIIGVAFADMDEFERAEKTIVRALDDARRAGLPDGQLLGDLHRSLGYTLWRNGRPNEADPHTREALRIFSKTYGQESGEVGGCLVNLGSQLDAQGHYGEAIEAYQKALSILREARGNEDADVARALNNLAGTYARIGRDDESERMHRQALPLHRRLYGDVSFQTALSCENLAWAIIRRGAFDEAEPFVNEAIDTYTQVFGEAHSHTAYAIHVRGDLLMGRCEYAAAERTAKLWKSSGKCSPARIAPSRPSSRPWRWLGSNRATLTALRSSFGRCSIIAASSRAKRISTSPWL